VNFDRVQKAATFDQEPFDQMTEAVSALGGQLVVADVRFRGHDLHQLGGRPISDLMDLLANVGKRLNFKRRTK
jgi:hypothetical protein